MYPCRLALSQPNNFHPFTPLSRPREQSLEHREAPLENSSKVPDVEKRQQRSRTFEEDTSCLLVYLSSFSNVAKLGALHVTIILIATNPKGPVECIPSEGWTACGDPSPLDNWIRDDLLVKEMRLLMDLIVGGKTASRNSLDMFPYVWMKA